VNEIFAQSFSSGGGWSFEGCQGALGHTFRNWKRSNSHELRIGVIHAVEGPFTPPIKLSSRDRADPQLAAPR
jgi:hypothetical protein